MGNSPPRIKLHYVKEQDRVLTGLIQILDSSNNDNCNNSICNHKNSGNHNDKQKKNNTSNGSSNKEEAAPPTNNTMIEELEVYVIGREKISWVAANGFVTLKESHTFFQEKVNIKVSSTDMEPTFSIPLPDDLPPSGHGGNYGKGLGYAIGYHVLVEAKGRSDINAWEGFTVALGKTTGTPPSNTVAKIDKGSMKFGKRILEYEIPKGMPRGTNQIIRLKLSEGIHQRVRIRLREVGKHLKGQEQVQSEIKYELEDDAVIGTEWTPIPILISRYANTARTGVVLQISHVLEITMIGGTQSIHFVNIPITLQ